MNINDSAVKKIGMLIRECRKAKGMTQEQLAERSGTTFSYIGGLERGERNVTIRTLERVAAALQMDFLELVSIGGSSKNKTITEINALLLQQDPVSQEKALAILKELFKR